MKSFIGPMTRGGRPLDPTPTRREETIEQSDVIDVCFAGTTSKAHAIPSGAYYVNFSATDDFYAKFVTGTGSIAVPTGDVTDGSAPALNPGTRIIPEGADHIAIIAPNAATVVTLEFWTD